MLLFLSACGKKEAEAENKMPGIEAIPVRLTAISQVPAQKAITVGGLLGTENEARLSFKTGGIIQKINVKVGDPVRRGQVLARLDMTEISAAVAQAQLAFEKAQRDFDRVTALHKDSVATLENLQNAKTGLELARQGLNSAKFNQAHSEIIAPGDGFVTMKLMNEGETAGPGMPIVIISNTSAQSKWVLKAGLSDKDWSVVQEGDSAKVTLDAYAGSVFEGIVSRKPLGADPYSGSFQVEITLNLGNAKPGAGLFGEATILPQKRNKYWMLPYESVLEANGNDAFVFVTTDKKTAKRVAVKIAYLDAKTVAISEGLEGYESVIATGSAYLADQSPISIAE